MRLLVVLFTLLTTTLFGQPIKDHYYSVSFKGGVQVGTTDSTGLGFIRFTEDSTFEGYTGGEWKEFSFQNIAYGEIGFSEGDTITLIEDSLVILTNDSLNLWSGNLLDTLNLTYRNDSIIVNKEGLYSLSTILSVDGKSGSELQVNVLKNGVSTCNCGQIVRLANNRKIALSYIDLVRVSVGDVLQVALLDDTETDTVDLITGKLVLYRIAD